MNITDYLVEYLKKGNNVEIPQVGVLATREIAAHYDIDSSTFYPTTYTVEMSRHTIGDRTFVEYLAGKECISIETADRILKNYGDALIDKIEKEGECRIGDLGKLVQGFGGYDFQPDEGLRIDNNRYPLEPVKGVRYFVNESNIDPFANFEGGGEEPQADEPTQESNEHTRIEPEEDLRSETVEEIEKEIVEEIIEQEEIVEEVEAVIDEEEKGIEVKRDEESDAEEAEKDEVVSQEESEEAHEAEQPRESKEEETESVVETVEEDEVEVDIKEEAETEENKNSTGEEVEPIEEGREDAADDTIDTLKKLEEIVESEEDNFFEDVRKKKKRKGWRWILYTIIILIVLIVCTFVLDHYLFNSKGRNWVADAIGVPELKATTEEDVRIEIPTIEESEEGQEMPEYDKEKASDNITEYTFSLKGLAYDESEITEASKTVSREMRGYYQRYLTTQKQQKQIDLFAEKAERYASDRLHELLSDNEFDGHTLFNYDDYVRTSSMGELKDKQMRRKKAVVMTELMDRNTLNRLMNEMIEENGLQQATPTETAQTKQVETTKAKPAATTSSIRTESKQGFDIIAGFYVNKGSADQMCRKLKSKGCDAYIINKNGMYYVSMGSASTRTEADAKYNHIKEWYKEDISIKQW